MFGTLICSVVAVEVLAFCLVWAGKCSWHMQIFSYSALVNSQVSSYPGRGGQELNGKYRSKDSKLCTYLLITSWFRALFSSILFLRDQKKISVTYVHIPWNCFTYTDTVMMGKFWFKKKTVFQKISHFWSYILG